MSPASTQDGLVAAAPTAVRTPSGRVRLRALEAASYQRHAIHGDDRVWAETNCYTDLWVEVLHGLGLDPVPALAPVLGLDFEGDQYTFYKVSHEDLRDLYGIEVQELNIWKPLVEHAAEQVALGRVFVPEVDAWWLPDTAGVSYRLAHAKTSVAMQDIDVRARRLGYWHNAAYHELSGDDFDGVFRLDPALAGEQTLPPYTEIAKLDALQVRSADELHARAVALLRRQLGRLPARNPVARHHACFEGDLAWIRAGDVARFHQYAFATFRQLGSGFELAGAFLQWLEARGEPGLAEAIAGCDAIAKTSKVVQFRLARAAMPGREVDFAPMFDTLERSWDTVMERLVARHGG